MPLHQFKIALPLRRLVRRLGLGLKLGLGLGLCAAALYPNPPEAHAQGIRFGGNNDAQQGQQIGGRANIRQEERQNSAQGSLGRHSAQQNNNNQFNRTPTTRQQRQQRQQFRQLSPKSGPKSKEELRQQRRAAQAQRKMLNEAKNLRARFRQQNPVEPDTSHTHRYGFVVAFMDSPSLMDPAYIKGLKRLKKVRGIEFLVFQSDHSLDKEFTLEQTKALAKKLEDVDPIMARDDSGGRIAKQYGVTKFPTILYERPNHQVEKLHVPHSLNKIFRLIRAEKRKQQARR